jgi:hypothetical protein
MHAKAEHGMWQKYNSFSPFVPTVPLKMSEQNGQTLCCCHALEQNWRNSAQAEIEKQNCKCAQCGGPLDIDQQMMGLPPNKICDFCCEEMIADTEKYGEEVA